MEEEDIIKILVSSDNHVGFLERDPIRGEDSFLAFEEVLGLAFVALAPLSLPPRGCPPSASARRRAAPLCRARPPTFCRPRGDKSHAPATPTPPLPPAAPWRSSAST